MPDVQPTHCVAVIGGATAGAEVASRLSERGILVAVFEQNPRPFGKIEDGLPRWHVNLRNKEYRSITEKLSHPLVHFVPNTRVGRDVDFAEMVNDWGFTAVVLANGAWRDRALPIEDAEQWVGRGLVYQNPFVTAFNHVGDPNYRGETFEILDDSIVVGGGLASIDVAKIHTLHCTIDALAKRGIDVELEELEIKGIPKVLAAHDLAWEELGLAGSTIFYRRRIEDMPLVTMPADATPEKIAKVEKGRRTMVDKACGKYMFTIEPLSAPDALLIEDDRVVGMRFRRTRVEGGRVHMTDETFARRGSCVISSIGSIPEPIEGIAMNGELFAFTDWEFGRLEAYPSVFSVGNVVTGKGYIGAARKHAARVSHDAIERFLGVGEGDDSNDARPISEAASVVATEVMNHTFEHPPVPAEVIESVTAKIKAAQDAAGYPGDLKAWLERVGDPC